MSVLADEELIKNDQLEVLEIAIPCVAEGIKLVIEYCAHYSNSKVQAI